MPHHLLDELDIICAFTESCAESVPQVMDAKMGKKLRLTIFQFSLIQFFHVVRCGNAFNGPIDIMSGEKTSVAISEDETVITTQHQFVIRILVVLSSLSFPVWLNFFIRWAWESDGVACS